MYTITKEFSFDAGHHLGGLREGHKCARPHGHTYRVVVELAAERLDERGFVLDYGDMDGFRRLIDERYDHRDLNQVVDFNPTAENLARHFFGLAYLQFGAALRAVRVSETPNTCAEYRPTVTAAVGERQ